MKNRRVTEMCHEICHKFYNFGKRFVYNMHGRPVVGVGFSWPLTAQCVKHTAPPNCGYNIQPFCFETKYIAMMNICYVQVVIKSRPAPCRRCTLLHCQTIHLRPDTFCWRLSGNKSFFLFFTSWN